MMSKIDIEMDGCSYRRRKSTVSRTPASLSRRNGDGEYNCDDRSFKKKKSDQAQPRCNTDNNAALDLILSQGIILPRSFSI